MSETLHTETAWATGGRAYDPTEHCCPGVDTVLIKKEEGRIATAHAKLTERLFHRSVPISSDLTSKKQALKEQALDTLCHPDICRCAGGKLHCHLNIHGGTRALITRKPVHYCSHCLEH
ncbi:MAG: hypothetical protein PHH40_04585 [Candidatus Moranbacteria bacterium]|nr:hypothetical protein [Candidatus Moranbacteria bacterium]MDD3964486.1 hypothetical protein [Candidatus Moranbacteria bacterium]